MFAVPAVITAAGATYAYVTRKPKTDDETTEKGEADEAEEMVEKDDAETPSEGDAIEAKVGEASKSWRTSAGRDSGPEGYVFGDLTRGVVVKLWGGKDKTEEEQAIEAAGDEQYTHVQMLVRDAVRIFRARGYAGHINISQTVAHFTESCMVRVEGPKDNVAPWEAAAEGKSDASLADVAMGEHGRSGKVFATLLARLERRASAWQAMSGLEGVDPSLTSSAHIGFALPVIKIGWGVSVSLTVTTSSLLRFATHAAELVLS